MLQAEEGRSGLLVQAAPGSKRGQRSGHLGDASPADSTPLTLSRPRWLRRLPGLWGPEGALQASGRGRQGGRRQGRLGPTVPFHPSPISHQDACDAREVLPGPRVSAHLVTSYFQFPSVTVAETIPLPPASHRGQRGTPLASSRCCWGGGRCGCGGRWRN